MLGDGARGIPLGFQFYAGVSGVYDTGLTPVSVDQSGNLISVDHLYGVEANLGLVGSRRWQHSSVGLSYAGNYRHYSQNTYYDGSDHVLSLDGRTRLSPHVSLVSRNAAGTVSRTVSGLGGLVSTPDSLLGLPSNDIFDNRTYFIQTTDDLEYQKSARLSFTMGGDGFFVRRQSKALIGVNGYGAHATVAYRVSKISTLDVAYTYLHFDYPRAFGESDIHQATAGFSRALNERWTFNIMFGAYRVDTIGITTVALDPATAALFGQSTAVVAFNAIRYMPAGGASLSGKFKHSTFSVDYGRRPNPGNGVFLTSNSESVSGSYSYDGISRWSFSVTGGWNRFKSVGQTSLGTFSSGMGGAGASYRLGRNLHVAARADFRQAQVSSYNGFNRLGSRVTLSLNYSPGERPLSLWR